MIASPNKSAGAGRAFRHDLEISRQETPNGETVYVVKDPLTERFYRFGEAEYFILQQLDGATGPEEIQARAEAEFGEELDRETLDAFVNSLWRRGLLESPETRAAIEQKRRGRLRGSLLYLRLKAYDPDRHLDWLAAKVRFFFTPYFVVFSAVLILLALGTVFANSAELGRDIAGIFRIETIFTAWIVILGSTILHEYAHGLTCKHFGGKVREMGFLLIFFNPGMYCNVSDAWLFPEKSKRLWVTFAGSYFEFFLWALSVLTWRVTAPETVFNYIALVVIATSGIRVFFNFVPLIKLDGYYMLSDWLEIPNLRARAFGYVGTRIKALWRWKRAAPSEITRRERRIYWTYGILAGLFSVWMLGFIASRIGGYLIGEFQGTGFVVFSCLLLVVFRRPLTRLFSRPAAKNLARGTSGSATRRVAILMALAAAGLTLVFVKGDLTVSGEFTVLPDHNADVRAQVEGIVEAVYVEEGDRAEEGALIARLSDLEKRAELAKISAEVRKTRADLKLLQAGTRAEEVEVARQEVETAKTKLEHARKRSAEAKDMHAEHIAKAKSTVAKSRAQLRHARKEQQRLKPLIEKRLVSQKDYAESEQAVAVRGRELEEAQADLKMVQADDLAEAAQDLAMADKEVGQAEAALRVLLAGNRPEEIEATEAEIARLQAEESYIQDQLARLEIRSPITGVVTTPKTSEMVGQLVERGDLILEVHDYSTAIGEILVSEKDIGVVRLGQEVILKARAYPDRSFTGRVTAIAATAMEEDEGLNRKVVRVNTAVDNVRLDLKPEMTGHGKVYAGERALIEILSRRLVRYIRVEFWSWW
jgi:multidrug resistance efflux pump